MATKVDLSLPDWFQDPMYQDTQNLSYSMGKNILAGKLPDFYSSLGQTGSPEFKNMLAMINAQTATAVNENLVRRNISRSGVGLASTAKAVADATTSLSWTDYIKAAGEKSNLLNTGLNTIAGVRSSALDLTGQKNQFGMQGAQLRLSADEFNANMEAKQAEAEAAKKAQKNAMWQQIISSVIGGANMAYGMGAFKGLGSAASGGSPGLANISTSNFGLDFSNFGK